MASTNGALPDFEVIRNIWSLDIKKATAAQKAIFLWYYDRYLPIVAGLEYFGDKFRKYHLLTDEIDVHGVKKVAVTVTSEAYGMLVYDNCKAKWEEMYKFRELNKSKGTKIPENDDKFFGKYTKTKDGKIPPKGFTEEGLDLLSTLQDELVAFREEDAANDKKMQKYALKMVKEKYKIPEDVTAPEKRRNKKRSKSVTPPSSQKKLRRLAE